MISSVSNQGAYTSSMMRGGMQRPAPPDPAELFSKTDANGDGTIDKVELSDALAAKSETEGAGNGPDADELFSMLDADGDGSITEEEHTQGLQNLAPQDGPQGAKGMMGPPTPPPPDSEEEEEELFAATDADGSGTIDLEELSSMLSGLSESEDSQESSKAEEFFALLDGDGDGAVTAEEHSLALEEMAADREEVHNAMKNDSALITAALQNYRFAAMDYEPFGGSQLSTSA